MKIRSWFIFIVYIASADLIFAQHPIGIDWKICGNLPKTPSNKEHPGLAGAFSGVIGNTLVIAGGANFADKMPWEGGIKKYYQDIYLMTLTSNNTCDWVNIQNKFPTQIAYGSSVTYGNKLICIGGENENGITDKIWQLSLPAGKHTLSIKHIADLPNPLTNLSATLLDHTIYIAGGESAQGVSNSFFCLNLHQIKKGVIKLTDIPVEVSHSLLLPAISKSGDHLFLMGGRKKNKTGISTLYDSVFSYSIKENKWMTKTNLPYALSALTGIQISPTQYLITSGDRGETFSLTEACNAAIQEERDPVKKQKLIERKNALQINHPGFSNEILLYEVVTNTWSIIGYLPYKPPVTTTALWWNHSIILPSGEIKAGVRTPDILMGQLK